MTMMTYLWLGLVLGTELSTADDDLPRPLVNVHWLLAVHVVIILISVSYTHLTLPTILLV